jgi:hypothetical protein
MDNLNENTFSFPNPPKHYKKFMNSENDLKIPEIDHLQKLDNFSSFNTVHTVNSNNHNFSSER